MTGTLDEAARKNPQLTLALPVVFESSIAQARDRHMLAQAEIIPVYVDLPRDEKLEYLRMMAAYNNARRMAFRARGRYGQTAADIVKQKINQLLSNTAPKMEKTLEIIEGDPSAPTLVFSLSIQSIETLRAKLEEKGIHARMITHELTDRAKRQEIVDGFGRDYSVLLSVGTLEVGFNVPNATREIIMANTGSLTRTEQRLGRVLRRDPRNPEKVAKVYVEVANGTTDAGTLRRVNQAYNRLKAKGFSVAKRAIRSLPNSSSSVWCKCPIAILSNSLESRSLDKARKGVEVTSHAVGCFVTQPDSLAFDPIPLYGVP